MKLQAILEQREAKLKKAQAMLDGLADDAEFTAEQTTEFDALMAEAEELKAKAERLQKVEAALQFGTQPTRQPVTAGQQPTTGRDDPPEGRIEIRYRHGPIKAFERVAANIREAEDMAYRAGQWVKAQFFGDPKAVEWCQNNYCAVLSTTDNTKGGIFVPDEMASAIIDLRNEYGVFRRVCRTWPMGSDVLAIPVRTGGITAAFIGESETATETAGPTFSLVSLTARKLYALSYYPEELDMDATIDIGNMVAEEQAYAFAVKEDAVGFAGTGSLADGGIVGVNVKIIGKAGAVDATAGNDQFTELDLADFQAVKAVLPKYARAGARWYISQYGFDASMARLAEALGGNTTAEIAAGAQMRFLGYPVEITESMPTVSTALDGAVMCLFANLNQAAALGDRRGMTMKRSTEVKFLEDQIALKGSERFDINVHSVGTASVVGPVAALLGNTS